MSRNKKPGRGAKFSEGTPVRSLRETDAGATGVVIRLTRRGKAWAYNVCMDQNCCVVTRREDELEELAGSEESHAG